MFCLKPCVQITRASYSGGSFLPVSSCNTSTHEEHLPRNHQYIPVAYCSELDDVIQITTRAYYPSACYRYTNGKWEL